MAHPPDDDEALIGRRVLISLAIMSIMFDVAIVAAFVVMAFN